MATRSTRHKAKRVVIREDDADDPDGTLSATALAAEGGDLTARLSAARALAAQYKREADSLERRVGELLEVRDLFREAAAAMTPPPVWKPPPSGGKPPAEIVALFSDLQTGERTDPRHVAGWGRYNYAILQARVGHYLSRLRRWVQIQRAGYGIRDCTVVGLGDLIAGEWHEDLARTNEFPIPLQVVAAGRQVAGFVSGLARDFRRVRLEWIGASNHGRTLRKPPAKAAALFNWDFAVCEHVRALLAAHTTVEVCHYPTRRQVITIQGYKFLCSHGDTVRAWMGVPWYGIERDLSREARRHLQAVQEQLRRQEPVTGGFDYGLGGHWHVPFVGPSFQYIVNGSFTGTTDLDDAVGRHAPPQQVSFLVSPKHGVFSPIAWRLDQEGEEAMMAIEGRDLVLGETP